MRKSMMVSVAAIALMASAGLASAQMSQGGGQAGSAQMKQDNPQQSGHPADTGKGGANTAQPRAGAEGSKAGGTKAEGSKAQGTTGQGTKTDNSKVEAPKKNDASKADAQKKSDTVGQAQPGSARQKQDAPQQSGHPADTGKGGPNTAQPSENRAGGSPSSTAQSSGSSTNANLTTEQRTKIRETIVAQKVAPEKNLNIQVSVGSIVPKTVRVRPLPATIVSIQPAWRGYMFFLVGDEIVIVEPGSLRIVAVLPA